MTRKILFAVMVLAVSVAGFGCVREASKDQGNTVDRSAILDEAKKEGLIMNDEEIVRTKDPSALVEDHETQPAKDLASYLKLDVKNWRAAALADVTGGQSFGLAHARFEQGTYTLIAEMGGLPALEKGFFYEGWLIQRGNPFRVLSTGRVEQIDQKFINVYTSREDLSSFDFYSLTREPEEGSPGPDGSHILEGMIR